MAASGTQMHMQLGVIRCSFKSMLFYMHLNVVIFEGSLRIFRELRSPSSTLNRLENLSKSIQHCCFLRTICSVSCKNLPLVKATGNGLETSV